MELQQKHFVSQNVYDIQEQAKTEDIYQTLQTPPTVVSRKASGRKIMVPLLIINILLLTTILLVTAIHYHHFRQNGEEVLNDQKTNQEMWYLHDDTFYLFWRNNSDCETAYKFCDERTADLATVTESNREWLQSHINGKRMLVKMSKSHISGDGLEDFPFMQFPASDLWPNEHYMVDSGDETECELFDPTSYFSEQVEGWVCARASPRTTTLDKVLNDLQTNQEMWYLHDHAFDLFWSNNSDCKTAYRFCNERTADLTIVTENNRDWLLSQINGKHLLVKHGHRRIIDGEPRCVIFGEMPHISEQVVGWVCEKKNRVLHRSS